METSTALTVTACAALALGSDKARTELAELVKKSANIVEVKNPAGREECHSAAMALVRARTNIEKIGKAARDDATKFSKAVIAEEKALIDITQPEETRLLALRNAWDEARAREKAEAERRAQAEADAAELARQRRALAEENARINAELEKQRAEHAAAAARLAEERAELERQKNPPVVVEPEPEPVVLTLVEKPQRPTDVQIVEAIASHFNVPAPVALSWLIDFQVDEAIEAFEGVAA